METLSRVIGFIFSFKAYVTRTVNIDIWNYWHFALTGALVQAASGRPPARRKPR